MTPEDRRGCLKETLEDFRKQARAELKRMYPGLNTAKGAPHPPAGFVSVSVSVCFHLLGG